MAEGDGAGGEEEEPLVYDDRDVLQVREGELPEEEVEEEEEEENEEEALGGGGSIRMH